MVTIRARELLFKTNFQIWQSGGKGENLPGSIPSATPSRDAAREGLRRCVGREGGSTPQKTKQKPQKWFGLPLGKKAEPRPPKPRGFCNCGSAQRGWRSGAAPAPAPGGEGAGAPREATAMDTAVPARTAAARQGFLCVRGFSLNFPAKSHQQNITRPAALPRFIHPPVNTRLLPPGMTL